MAVCFSLFCEVKFDLNNKATNTGLQQRRLLSKLEPQWLLLPLVLLSKELISQKHNFELNFAFSMSEIFVHF